VTIDNTLVPLDRDGRILTISLDRAAKRNAINRELADQLDAALNQLDDDPDIWVGVLTGTSEIFSAGSDLRSRGDYMTDRGGEYGLIRRRRKKPLIAAVEGIALGGGLEMVLACDLVVASETATFGLPEVSRGVVATSGALFRGPRALPLNVAREILLLGDPIGAARAYALGFVNVVTRPGEARAGALTLARRLCKNAPVAVRASMHALDVLADREEERGWAATEEAIATMSASEDAREGVRAFFEKREPKWSGR